MNQESKKEKPIYTCQYCQKVYKRKKFFEKHFEKCEDKEMQIFNYEGLIEEWKDIDPDFVAQFKYEIDLLTDNHTF